MSPIELGPLRLSEIAGFRNLGELPPFHCPSTRDEWSKREFWNDLSAHAKKHARVLQRAFSFFSELGGYPVCHKPSVEGTRSVLARQLIEDVVNKSLDNDPVRVGTRTQIDRAVIRDAFRLMCRYAGQAVSNKEFAGQITAVLGTGVKHATVDDAIQFLTDALLIHRIQPLEMHQKKQANPPKYCLCDHFVRNAWLQESIPIDPAELAKCSEVVCTHAGHLVESIIGYQLKGMPTAEVAWFPQRPAEPEVDFILTLGAKRLPIEVKYQPSIGVSDLKGLNAFCEKKHYEADFGLVITPTQTGDVGSSAIAIPASHFLLVL